MANNQANAPLTPAVLHILLALSTQERHGYGIMKQVESDSQGKVKMGPGTLYGSLGRMIDAGLIRESDKKVDPKMDDERRVYYKITALGQKALAAELERYREVVAVARQMRLLPNALSMAMADEHAIARYRHWYRKLLRFYSRPYRERFAEGMEQTFNDLCRERAGAGRDWAVSCSGCSSKHPRELSGRTPQT